MLKLKNNEDHTPTSKTDKLLVGFTLAALGLASLSIRDCSEVDDKTEVISNSNKPKENQKEKPSRIDKIATSNPNNSANNKQRNIDQPSTAFEVSIIDSNNIPVIDSQVFVLSSRDNGTEFFSFSLKEISRDDNITESAGKLFIKEIYNSDLKLLFVAQRDNNLALVIQDLGSLDPGNNIIKMHFGTGTIIEFTDNNQSFDNLDCEVSLSSQSSRSTQKLSKIKTDQRGEIIIYTQAPDELSNSLIEMVVPENVLDLLYSKLDSKSDADKARDFYYNYKKMKGNSILSQESLRLLSLMEDKFKIQILR